MNEDLLHTQLHASLDALTPTSRSAQSLRTAGRRRRRLREGAVALTVVALLGGVALSLTGSDDHAALQPADPTPTATAPSNQGAEPKAAWATFLAGHPGAVHSDVLVTHGTAFGAYAEDSRLHLLRYDNGWVGEASDYEGFGAQVTGLTLAVLTSGPGPDVVATTTVAANEAPTYVLRDNSGSFQYATFVGCDGAPCPGRLRNHVADGKIIGGKITSTYYPCNADCSGASPVTVTWVFNSATGQFEIVPRSGACDPSTHPLVYNVTNAVVVNGVVRLEFQVDEVVCGGPDDVHFTPTGPVRHIDLASNAHVEVLPPNGSPTSTVIRPDELPQQLLLGTNHTFVVVLTGGQVSSLIEAYHP